MAEACRVKKMKLGSQGLEVSAQGPSKPETDAIALLHHAIRSGVTFLDTSDVYGPETNELLLGKVREKVELATKFGATYAEGKREVRGDPEYVRVACEASLKRLDVACIDLYYQHRVDSRVPIEMTVSLLLLWDLAEGKKLYSLEAGSVIHSLCFSPNRYSLCATTENSIRIWDLESKCVVEDLKVDLKTEAEKSFW